MMNVTLPIELPGADEIREMCRELLKAELEPVWFDFAGAAAYLKVSLRTFMRRKKKWGLPVAELSPGLKIVYRRDLDALALSHLVKGRARTLIEFPSVAENEKLRAETLKAEMGRAAA
jgi:hypothetical protein